MHWLGRYTWLGQNIWRQRGHILYQIIIIQILWKCVSTNSDFDDPVRLQFCSCHDSSAVGTWTKLWPDLIIISQIKMCLCRIWMINRLCAWVPVGYLQSLWCPFYEDPRNRNAFAVAVKVTTFLLKWHISCLAFGNNNIFINIYVIITLVTLFFLIWDYMYMPNIWTSLLRPSGP